MAESTIDRVDIKPAKSDGGGDIGIGVAMTVATSISLNFTMLGHNPNRAMAGSTVCGNQGCFVVAVGGFIGQKRRREKNQATNKNQYGKQLLPTNAHNHTP